MALFVILLLTSGYVTVSSQIVRSYSIGNTPLTWNDSQNYCRTNYIDLATIVSYADMQQLVSMLTALGVTQDFWIGLEKTGPASWLWSVGETSISEGVVNYTNWASLPNSTDNCGGMQSDGKWFSAPCTTTLPYLCQDITSTSFTLYYENKNWSDAQQDCRVSSYDLASARSQAENQELQQIMNTYHNVTSLWIGLFRDDWEWSDRNISSFRDWASGEPSGDGSCSLYSPSHKGFMDRNCSDSLLFLCSAPAIVTTSAPTVTTSGTQQLKFYVKVAMMSSFNLNGLAVSETILKQIQSKFQGASVQWRVQPDGNIFTKKEQSTIISTC